MKDGFIFFFIHFGIPILGLIFYLWLVVRMRKAEIPKAPLLPLLGLTLIYSFALMLILTDLIWRWSALASLGLLLSNTIGCFIALICSIALYRNRSLSVYHRWSFWTSVIYIALVLASISIGIVVHL